jgi:uncharacterized protein YdiU (UPF0061 family)
MYWPKYYSMLANKLGLDTLKSDDYTLIEELEKNLSALKPDMTIFYQLLMELPSAADTEEQLMDHFRESFYKEPKPEEAEKLTVVLKAYLARKEANTISGEESLQLMRKANPRFVLRNYLLHQAIQELEKGEDTLFVKLQEALKDPYSRKFDEFFARRPDWASQKAGCSMLSCSS